MNTYRIYYQNNVIKFLYFIKLNIFIPKRKMSPIESQFKHKKINDTKTILFCFHVFLSISQKEHRKVLTLIQQYSF